MRVLGRAVSNLAGRTRAGCVGAEHTAFALLGPQDSATSRAGPEMDAGIQWHLLGGLVFTNRAGNRGGLNHWLALRFGIGLTMN